MLQVSHHSMLQVRDPFQAPVWEITGAEFSETRAHTADGISIRFPRVTRIRTDKGPDMATSLRELKALVKASKAAVRWCASPWLCGRLNLMCWIGMRSRRQLPGLMWRMLMLMSSTRGPSFRRKSRRRLNPRYVLWLLSVRHQVWPSHTTASTSKILTTSMRCQPVARTPSRLRLPVPRVSMTRIPCQLSWTTTMLATQALVLVLVLVRGLERARLPCTTRAPSSTWKGWRSPRQTWLDPIPSRWTRTTGMVRLTAAQHGCACRSS